MSSKDHVRNIAVVGASGNVGGAIVRSLQQVNSFKITAISRADSTATFGPDITVQKGDYTSSAFLESALQGQDVLIITLPNGSPPDLQSDFIKAAAKAGVPWILPNEYGSDGANQELVDKVSILQAKIRYRKEIEELGRSSWIGVISNVWFDFGLKGGWFDINIPAHKATLYDNGTNPFTTTTVPQVGRAVARLLSLPVHSSSSEPSLTDYKNKFIYINSFSASQADILASVQRATGTKEADWSVTHIPVEQYIAGGEERLAKGDPFGIVAVLFGCTYKRGLGDQFYGREVANEKLGLEEEDVDEVVKGVVKELEAKEVK